MPSQAYQFIKHSYKCRKALQTTNSSLATITPDFMFTILNFTSIYEENVTSHT